MSNQTISTRRSILKGGALLAAPLVAAAPSVALAASDGEDRLKRLEDERAIEALHKSWLRRVNGGASSADLFAEPRRAAFAENVQSIAADLAAAEDAIEVAADGKSATGRFHSLVELETELAQDCTLAQMKHAQGENCIRHIERRLIRADYVKAGEAWAIAKVELA